MSLLPGPLTGSTSCPACHHSLDPSARSTDVILLTLGQRRYYHHLCLQRVARLPGPFLIDAA